MSLLLGLICTLVNPTSLSGLLVVRSHFYVYQPLLERTAIYLPYKALLFRISTLKRYKLPQLHNYFKCERVACGVNWSEKFPDKDTYASEGFNSIIPYQFYKVLPISSSNYRLATVTFYFVFVAPEEHE
nr:hypothetical transcript [Hymenolepis microstoma]